MSDHGTFVTECGLCERCAAALIDVVDEWPDTSASRVHRPAERPGRTGAVAGFVSTIVGGGEFLVFDTELRLAIEAGICHPLSIAVFGEDTRCHVLDFNPTRYEEEL